jgi:hypothetical protein
MSLTDQDTCMMDGLCKSELEDLGLEATFQKVLNLEAENVIKLHASLIENSNTYETTEERIALEQSTGVLILKGEEVTSGLTDLGQAVLDTPDLTLILQTIFTDKL